MIGYLQDNHHLDDIGINDTNSKCVHKEVVIGKFCFLYVSKSYSDFLFCNYVCSICCTTDRSKGKPFSLVLFLLLTNNLFIQQWSSLALTSTQSLLCVMCKGLIASATIFSTPAMSLISGPNSSSNNYHSITLCDSLTVATCTKLLWSDHTMIS